MFGIGGQELLLILVVALLVLGPKKMPELARTLGRLVGEFRRVSTDFQRNLNTEIALEESLERERRAADNVGPPRKADAVDAVSGHPGPDDGVNAAQSDALQPEPEPRPGSDSAIPCPVDAVDADPPANRPDLRPAACEDNSGVSPGAEAGGKAAVAPADPADGPPNDSLTGSPRGGLAGGADASCSEDQEHDPQP